MTDPATASARVTSSHEAAPRRARVTVVTGFLGVGKTTVLQRLLARRPSHERWAILVNEFGELGVDGAVLRASNAAPRAATIGEARGVTVREVPGGCLCCATAPLFDVALHQLLKQRPNRLLIEPTGLGHPIEILHALDRDEYRGWIDRRATWTLFDPRHLASPRHREHPIWNDQIHIADVLIATKSDLCDAVALDQARRFMREHSRVLRHAIVAHGAVDPQWLDLSPRADRRALTPEADRFLRGLDPRRPVHPNDAQHDPHHHATPADDLAPRRDGVVVETRRDGVVLYEWDLASEPVDAAAVRHWLDGLALDDASRLKMLVRTHEGWWLAQRVGRDPARWQRLDAPPDGGGRIEWFTMETGRDTSTAVRAARARWPETTL